MRVLNKDAGDISLEQLNFEETDLNNLRKVFKKNISADSDKLVRLESFNVKTSVLDFFQNINNLISSNIVCLYIVMERMKI